jgi:hypothetical protein
MKKIALFVVVAFVMLGVVAWAEGQAPVVEGLRGENKKIEISEVPEKFMTVAKKAVPGAAWTHAQINYDLGKHESLVVYEITGKKDGTEVEVDVRADGSIEEIEEVIDVKDVPKPVIGLLHSEYPDFKIKKAERSTRPYRNGNKVIWYELKGTTKQGATIDVEITEDSKYYIVEAD